MSATSLQSRRSLVRFEGGYLRPSSMNRTNFISHCASMLKGVVPVRFVLVADVADIN